MLSVFAIFAGALLLTIIFDAGTREKNRAWNSQSDRLFEKKGLKNHFL
jgi:hypothetical protein